MNTFSKQIAAALLAALMLSGCGLKGDLYLEDEPDAQAQGSATTEQDAAGESVAQP